MKMIINSAGIKFLNCNAEQFVKAIKSVPKVHSRPRQPSNHVEQELKSLLSGNE